MTATAVAVAITSRYWLFINLSFVADLAADFDCSEFNTPAAEDSLAEFVAGRNLQRGRGDGRSAAYKGKKRENSDCQHPARQMGNCVFCRAGPRAAPTRAHAPQQCGASALVFLPEHEGTSYEKLIEEQALLPGSSLRPVRFTVACVRVAKPPSPSRASAESNTPLRFTNAPPAAHPAEAVAAPPRPPSASKG